MRLDALLPNDKRLSPAMATIDIRGLSADSRKVKSGYLFAALAGVSGVSAHGRDFIPEAVAQGAAVILSDSEVPSIQVPLIIADNPRQELAYMASRFFDYRPENFACITGTNGKTSTANFLRQLWGACGYAAAALGTLGVEADHIGETLSKDWHHTTADPVQLHSVLRDLYAYDITHLVLEASSHGLAQHRLDGIRPQVAAFTNLTRDHLDYHETYAAYFGAKCRLFTDVLADNGTAIIHIGSEVGQAMVLATQNSGRKVITISREEADISFTPMACTQTGTEARLTYQGKTHNINVPLIGAFQIDNLAVALGMALAFGADLDTLLKACATIKPARGRMQYIGRTKKGAAIYVDYAHTPDALENALASLRAHTQKQLHIVFGCGGDRDKGKRPEMGAVATRLADTIIITDDNPRTENADTIRSSIIEAAPQAKNIGDRAEAIATALNQAQKDDIVLIAGKGHETRQFIGDTSYPFDDAAHALAQIEKGGNKDV